MKNDYTARGQALLLTPWPEGPPFDGRQFDPAVLWSDPSGAPPKSGYAGYH
jgi:hypothetical protein